jgi:hypothetical protein
MATAAGNTKYYAEESASKLVLQNISDKMIEISNIAQATSELLKDIDVLVKALNQSMTGYEIRKYGWIYYCYF